MDTLHAALATTQKRIALLRGVASGSPTTSAVAGSKRQRWRGPAGRRGMVGSSPGARGDVGGAAGQQGGGGDLPGGSLLQGPGMQGGAGAEVQLGGGMGGGSVQGQGGSGQERGVREAVAGGVQGQGQGTGHAGAAASADAGPPRSQEQQQGAGRALTEEEHAELEALLPQESALQRRFMQLMNQRDEAMGELLGEEDGGGASEQGSDGM